MESKIREKEYRTLQRSKMMDFMDYFVDWNQYYHNINRFCRCRRNCAT